MRLDIEELHGFIKAAFGKDYTQASSKGDTGSAGAAGATGPAGADGNSHLSNITSIGINSKTGQLEIVIGTSTYKFNTDK